MNVNFMDLMKAAKSDVFHDTIPHQFYGFMNAPSKPCKIAKQSK